MGGKSLGEGFTYEVMVIMGLVFDSTMEGEEKNVLVRWKIKRDTMAIVWYMYKEEGE